jgi:hypothetical protein
VTPPSPQRPETSVSGRPWRAAGLDTGRGAETASREMNVDLTDRFHRFLAAARQLPGAADDEVALLFRAIVMYPLPAAAVGLESGAEVLDAYRVELASADTTVLVSSDLPAAGAWDHPVPRLDPATTDLRLIAPADLGGAREFQFLRVRIVRADAADLAGRDAGVEADCCRIGYAD